MEDAKAKKFLVVTSFISIIILLIGATFSYFTLDTKSELNALRDELKVIPHIEEFDLISNILGD